MKLVPLTQHFIDWGSARFEFCYTTVTGDGKGVGSFCTVFTSVVVRRYRFRMDTIRSASWELLIEVCLFVCLLLPANK